MLRTAILIDGSKDPVALRTDQQTPFIASNIQGRIKNFELKATVGQKGEVLLYCEVGLQLSDEEFKQLAEQEADKHLHPEKYKDLGKIAKAA